MQTQSRVVATLIGLLLVSLHGLAETNQIDWLVTLPTEQAQRYLRSLREDAALKLASEAYEKGWDDYAIAVGIVRPSIGMSWERTPPTAAKLASIIVNTNLHPGLRGSIAAGGLAHSTNWECEQFLAYVDTVIDFFESPDVEYRWKWKIPDYLQHALTKKLDAFLSDGDVTESERQLIDQLYMRAERIVNDLIRMLKTRSVLSEDSMANVTIALSEFVGWSLAAYPVSKARRSLIDAAERGRDVLISTLLDTATPRLAARCILRFGDEIDLGGHLSEKEFESLKSDRRFSDEEGRRLLDLLQRRRIDKISERATP